MLTLYHHPLSTYSRRVSLVLIEKGIEADLITVDMVNREHRGDTYKARNPYGRVPCLEDDGVVIYESATIMEYLERKFPTPALAPADNGAWAQMSMHLRLCDSEMAQPTGVIIFPKRFLPPERWDRSSMDAAKKKIDKHLVILSKQIAEPYILGASLSLVDLAYLPFLEFLPLMEIQPPENIAAWCERLHSRPSACQTKPAQ